MARAPKRLNFGPNSMSLDLQLPFSVSLLLALSAKTYTSIFDRCVFMLNKNGISLIKL